MPSCFVFGCKSGYGRTKENHVFRVPSKANEETRQQWLRNLPKRQDKPFDFKTCYVCHKHFEDHFIVKKIIVNAALNMEVDRKKWTLTPNAIPTIFESANLPSYFTKTLKSRRPPLERTSESVEQKQLPAVTNFEVVCSNTVPEADHTSVHWRTEALSLKLPSGWMAKLVGSDIFYSRLRPISTAAVESFYTERSVKIPESRSPVVCVHGKTLEEQMFPPVVMSTTDILNCVSAVDLMDLCQGAGMFQLFTSYNSAYRCGSVWFSENCKLATKGVCYECQLLRDSMSRTASSYIRANKRRDDESKLASNRNKEIEKTKRIRHKAASAIRKLNRAKKKNDELKLEVKVLKDKFRKVEMTCLNEYLEKTNLPPQLRLALTTAVSVQKAKSASGRRYPADWILQAMLLKITSPKAYKHLRSEGILPLPNPNYLTRMLSGCKCEFGFSEFVFKWLKTEFLNKPRKDRQAFLIFDEMKVKESISYSKASMKFTGFIDYDEFSGIVSRGRKELKEADHALVFMVRFLNSKLTQPIASFATRGAAPGNALAKIILSAIVRLEEIGVQIVGVVSDGATTNKAAWNSLGIKSTGTIINKIVNPCDDTRYVHFLCDIPHIVKCIRNHFCRHRKCSFKGNQIDWRFYDILYETDSKSDLRVAPKLSLQHIRPNPFQKMTVSLAVQVFSKTVADALKFYRQVNVAFKGSENTEEFTRVINGLFDACNGRAPKDGITPSSPGYMIIKTFLMEMEEADTYASDRTLPSLKVTLQSILDLTEYLCTEVGYAYVLPAKFNQDCLERFFGLVRSFGGDNSHPTITSFGHLFRLLSVYNPCSRVIKGNVQDTEELHVNSLAYLDVIGTFRGARDEEFRKRRQLVENTVLSKIIRGGRDLQENEKQEASGSVSNIACVVYHLAGYVAFKSKRFSNCGICVSSLSDPSYNPKDSLLTDLKNLGGLKKPSEPLHLLLRNVVEPAIGRNLNSTEMFSQDFILKLVDDMKSFESTGIGCPAHSESLIVEIIIYYITIRMYFFTKAYNRERLTSSVKAKQKFKEGKLN